MKILSKFLKQLFTCLQGVLQKIRSAKFKKKQGKILYHSIPSRRWLKIQKIVSETSAKRHHPFNTNAQFSKKQHFSPCDTHTCAWKIQSRSKGIIYLVHLQISEKWTFLTPCTCAYQWVKNVSFSENCAYVLNE